MLITVVVLALALLAGGGLWWTFRDTPEKAVQRYFDKIQFASVADMSEVAVISPAQAAEASRIPPSMSYAQITSMSTRGNDVTVTYTTPGGSRTQEMSTTKVDGKYKLVMGHAKLTLNSTSATEVPLNYQSKMVPTNKSLVLWPGGYKLMRQPSPWYDLSGPDQIDLQPGQDVNYWVDAQVNDAGRQHVAQLTRSALRRCVGSDASRDNCPSSLANPPAGTYWYPVSMESMESAIIVARNQQVDKVCATGSVPVQLKSRSTTEKGSVNDARIRACFDLHQDVTSDKVVWS